MIGHKLGHNRVVEKIGEGGMGAVYRGVDEHLQRDVAIKVLPSDALSDDSARRRFRKEAHALSRLNHPNVETVFDFDADAGVDYLVIEYIEGLTLRQMLAVGPLAEKEILALGVQIAEGLAAAHERGIVHCDLKPSNVMVTSSGRAKILDFGLAMLLKRGSDEESTDSSDGPRSGGGTIPYMAPEQVCGEPVDARTDIYALGNLLFEMATGRRPFEGTLSTALANDIVHRPPPPPVALRPALSPRLAEIILKCLEKSPDSRYQSAREAAVDLRRLSDPVVHPSTGDPYLKRRRLRQTMAVLALVAIGLVAGVLVARRWRESERPVLSFEPRRITSSPGWHREPAVSSDGNYVAYAADNSGNLDIYVTHQREGREERLTSNPASDSKPAWFPDNSIAFESDRLGRPGIWKVTLLGKIESLLVEDASHPAVSQDGTMLAFVKSEGDGKFRLAVAPTNDLSAVTFLETGTPEDWQYLCPAWSPDGRWLCFASRRNLWTIPAFGGKPVPLTVDEESDYEPAWSPDGSQVYFRSARGGTYAIWRINARGGTPKRVTTGTLQESHPALQRDGKALFHASELVKEQVFLLDRKGGRESSLTIDDAKMGAISPDRTRIAIVRNVLGPDIALWIQLLSNGRVSGPPFSLVRGPGIAALPTFSPDGDWLAFSLLFDRQMDIWIAPSGGGQRIRFTDDPAFDGHPSWSHDGRMLAFSSGRGGHARIWMAPVSNGRPAGPPQMVPGLDIEAYFPSWSPGGESIAFLGKVDGRFDAWIATTDGSKPARQVTRSGDVKYIRWIRMGALFVSGRWGGRQLTVRRFFPETGQSQPNSPSVDFGSDDSGHFDLSPDGQAIVATRKHSEGDIWLLKTTSGSF